MNKILFVAIIALLPSLSFAECEPWVGCYSTLGSGESRTVIRNGQGHQVRSRDDSLMYEVDGKVNMKNTHDEDVFWTR